MLLKEFLEPAGLSQAEAARQLRMPLNRLNQIIKGKRAVSADTAWRLATRFDTTPESWLSLQAAYDLYAAKPAAGMVLTQIARAAKTHAER